MATTTILLKSSPGHTSVMSIHHIGIEKCSITSVNPARSSGVAFFAETAALSQLWLFWVAPIFGAIVGALIYKVVVSEKE